MQNAAQSMNGMPRADAPAIASMESPPTSGLHFAIKQLRSSGVHLVVAHTSKRQQSASHSLLPGGVRRQVHATQSSETIPRAACLADSHDAGATGTFGCVADVIIGGATNGGGDEAPAEPKPEPKSVSPPRLP